MMNKCEFPVEITKALTCLVEPARQKIAMLLLEKKSTWLELKNEFGFSTEDQSNHLLELTKAGIINRFVLSTDQIIYERYYAITDFGKDLLNGIFMALSPTIQKHV